MLIWQKRKKGGALRLTIESILICGMHSVSSNQVVAAGSKIG